jgi:hypothetical protein
MTMQYMSLLLALLVARGVADISGMGMVQTIDGTVTLSELINTSGILVKDGTGGYTQIELTGKAAPTLVLRIQTVSTSIEVTPDHIMSLDGPITASDVQVGDLLLVNGDWEIIVRIVKDLVVNTVDVWSRSGTLRVDGVTVPTHIYSLQQIVSIYWNTLGGQ